jgi:hypothetical protein
MTTKPLREKKNDNALSDDDLDKVSGGTAATEKGGGSTDTSSISGGGKTINPLTVPKQK